MPFSVLNGSGGGPWELPGLLSFRQEQRQTVKMTAIRQDAKDRKLITALIVEV